MNDQDKIHVLSRAAVIDQHEILLCKTLELEKNFYFLPGGHIKLTIRSIKLCNF